MTETYTPAIIQVDSGMTTFINVFTIAPDRQHALLALLRTQTDSLIRKQPGFLNANFHRSLDGSHVVNYVQWADQKSSEVIHENPEIMAGFAQYQSLNVKMDLRYYDVQFASAPAAIAPQADLKTLISLLAVEPNRQMSVLATLEREICPLMAQQSGFVSISLHRSLDGTRILIYSQWSGSVSNALLSLLQQPLLMHGMDGAIAHIETNVYTVAFTSNAEGLLIGSNA